MPYAIVVMGVSGCGKTTVGQTLAESLDSAFYDGDDFHPHENIAKMSKGIPLDDTDRQPWLERLRDLIAAHIKHDTGIVVASSALKKSYRDLLRDGNKCLQFVYIKGSFDLIRARMQAREGHYMKAQMLQSQFDELEEPTEHEAIIVKAQWDVNKIINHVMKQLSQ